MKGKEASTHPSRRRMDPDGAARLGRFATTPALSRDSAAKRDLRSPRRLAGWRRISPPARRSSARATRNLAATHSTPPVVRRARSRVVGALRSGDAGDDEPAIHQEQEEHDQHDRDDRKRDPGAAAGDEGDDEHHEQRDAEH